MIEWIKTKAIIIISIILGLSLIGNGLFAWLVFKNGLKIERKTYITTNSQSNSISSSGSLALTILGQQQYYTGKFELQKEEFKKYEDAFQRARQLNICDWSLAQIIPHYTGDWIYGVWYQKFVTHVDEKKGPVITTTKTIDGQ